MSPMTSCWPNMEEERSQLELGSGSENPEWVSEWVLTFA